MLIGINPWPLPHNSEQYPIYKPLTILVILTQFIRPGIASTLIPNTGNENEWITSNEDIIKLVHVLLWINNGLYIGYCSELCGSGHGFMPINMVVY